MGVRKGIRPATPEEREAGLWVSCPVCNVVPGEVCTPNNKNAGEWQRLQARWGGMHTGRVKWLRDERRREAA